MPKTEMIAVYREIHMKQRQKVEFLALNLVIY
jgi:hypothetical protein